MTGCTLRRLQSPLGVVLLFYKLDINTLHRNEEDKVINMNDIARVVIRTTKPLFTDSYRKNRITGALIFVDEGTNETVGAGMII